ncbi:zinc-ribbon domain-containing protein [Staphylococcus chromogenes]|uniref:zinc-ribbon domain-containing protein n=1 Tax=Staphylococcus chromogenes TaxID=46126 RepID=UPI002888F2E4|nr:HNH endonuclease [Staphylococcus chromogenes]MDT0739728.1 hypothetical protein [Staphylococcus chromogenes]
MAEKLTLSKIKTKLKTINSDIEILSESYVNSKTHLLCKCKKCSHNWEITWQNLSKGRGCPKCKNKRIGNKLRLSQNEVKSRLEKIGFILLDSFYYNHMLRVVIKDLDGYKYEYYYRNLINGRKPSAFGKNNRFKKYNVKKLCEKRGLKYLKYRDIKSHTEVFVQCKSNHKYWVDVYSLKKGRGCWECWIENNKGIKSPFYNPLLTNEERIKTRYQLNGNNHVLWAKKVYKRDWYKCKICGSKKKINAHHLNSYHAFPDERFDVDNGVTLCTEHHKDFHRKYGNKNNTKEQFEEYLKSVQ